MAWDGVGGGVGLGVQVGLGMGLLPGGTAVDEHLYSHRYLEDVALTFRMVSASAATPQDTDMSKH